MAEIDEARLTAPVVSVQNQYNLVDRKSEDVLEYCEREGLGFIPWNPVAVGRLAEPDSQVAEVARQAGCTHPARSRWPGCCAVAR